MRLTTTRFDHQLSPYYLLVAYTLVEEFGLSLEQAMARIRKQLAQQERDRGRMQLQWDEPVTNRLNADALAADAS